MEIMESDLVSKNCSPVKHSVSLQQNCASGTLQLGNCYIQYLTLALTHHPLSSGYLAGLDSFRYDRNF
jgi:hypothetical protein